MENEQQKKCSPLDNLSQTQMFGLGLGAGVLVLCTLGFFILLGVVLNGGGFNLGFLNSDKVAANEAGDLLPSPSAPTATQPRNNPAQELDKKEDHMGN